MSTRLSIYDQRKKNNALIGAFVIGAVLIVAFIALFLLQNGSVEAEGVQEGKSDTTYSLTTVSDRALGGQMLSPKLSGSTETVDEKGIIHGTTPEGINYTVFGRGERGKDSLNSVTVVAVGDQIGTDNSLQLADGYAGKLNDGKYDFTPFYKDIASFIDDYDLRYINQETCMAGEDRGIFGYPIFNSPDACADALGAVDFNMVSSCTNHTLDFGIEGALRTLDVLEEKTNSIVAGSYRSKEERDTVHMIERNGKNFAFLAYTYGDNMNGLPEDFPNDYILCGFDKEVMRTEIERAQQVADAVIVCMHWGTEYTTEPNYQQWEYAEFLADLDVDLVLGTHAHSMQPTKYVTGESGNTIPVVFGLSDFVSGWTKTNTILSGLLTGEFTWGDTDAHDDVDQGVTVGAGGMRLSNLKWYPAIEWSNGGDTSVRMLKDMDYETISQNTRTGDVQNDWEHICTMIESCGMDIEVIM